jgi:MYXO-CTERM domain-containing protein
MKRSDCPFFGSSFGSVPSTRKKRIQMLGVCAAQTVIVLSIFFVPQLVCAQESCFTHIGNLHDVSGEPLDTEWVDIARGVYTMQWQQEEYLVCNLGNEMKIWHLEDPITGTPALTSGWHPDVVDTAGSVFHALRGIAVCDDCSYGFAAFRNLGAIVFDMGTGEAPEFTISHTDPYLTYYESIGCAQLLGGAMYHLPGEPQYLLSVDLNGRCPQNGSKIYEVNGTDFDSMTEVAVLTTPTGEDFFPRRGQQYEHYIYLTPAWSPNELLVLDMQDPTNPDVVSLGHCFTSERVISVDTTQGYLAKATGQESPAIEIYDIADDPMNPQLIATVDSSHPIWATAICYPYLYGKDTTSHYKTVWDISSPTAATLIDDDYWNDLSYPHNDVAGLASVSATFHSTGQSLFLAGKSQLQIHAMGECVTLPDGGSPDSALADGSFDSATATSDAAIANGGSGDSGCGCRSATAVTQRFAWAWFLFVFGLIGGIQKRRKRQKLGRRRLGRDAP